ncbi:uncharacterized protein A4U43_C06F8250 [Asparagus officinalis]|uniref:Pectate lyase n=1 Tax=Asparagus officinalis TaxID=4686 RepID=A0A5P1EL03_ASPOF|nr:uncharacterized protein A4U43_C06F8250 [Asparagus officinalis]
MLFGASDHNQNDSMMQITLAFNHFGQHLRQRLPRARFGFVHIVNNDYQEWTMYAVGGSKHPTFISQGNRFRAQDNPFTKEATKREYTPEWEWKSWNWTSEGDVFENGAFFVTSGMGSTFDLTKNFSRFDVFRAKPGSFVGRLTRYAGALSCKVGEPC